MPAVTFDTGAFTGAAGARFCRNVIRYQVDVLAVTEVLLPGRYTNVRNEEWLAMHRLFADTAAEEAPGRPVYSTVAIGPDLILDQTSLSAVLDEVVAYPVDGVYFLYRSPNDDYLTSHDTFLLNLLVAFLSLSLAGKDVLLGYACQQDLLFAASGVRTIASGNFRNVRCFNPDIFDLDDEEEQPRRQKWCYDGNTLCEFRPQQLGMAYQSFGLRGRFGPRTVHSADLHDAPNPAVVPWPERSSFLHFLTVLRDQWRAFSPAPRALRAQLVSQFLDSCQTHLNALNQARFPLGSRSSADALASYRLSLDAFLALEEQRISLL